MQILVALIVICCVIEVSWTFTPLINNARLLQRCKNHNLWMATGDSDPASLELKAVAYTGITNHEYEAIQTVVESSLVSAFGFSVPCDTTNLIRVEEPLRFDKAAGILGRVLAFHTNLDAESIEALQMQVSQQLDSLQYEDPPVLLQPVLVSIRNPKFEATQEQNGDDNSQSLLKSIVKNMVNEFGLDKPVCNQLSKDHSGSSNTSFVPTYTIELDGAEVSSHSGLTWWDTSSVLVFDDLVSNDLRQRLLSVIRGSNESEWNDVVDGPDPDRWVRGGLLDVPEQALDDEDDFFEEGPCWGLRDEAIEELCFQDHDAIKEIETILTELFPQFIVSRLPEAVFGESVSPLTANAPTTGDQFDFHIDGDPNQAPPSPWTDVYGRYPNRQVGKPRFVSCLIYLNDEWNAEWGAPTKFLDPPTQETHEVSPKPGRCVFMDQDVSHSVVAPNPEAGKCPRYSMVWKLILHPREERQQMSDMANGRTWPEPKLVGSAHFQESKREQIV